MEKRYSVESVEWWYFTTRGVCAYRHVLTRTDCFPILFPFILCFWAVSFRVRTPNTAEYLLTRYHSFGESGATGPEMSIDAASQGHEAENMTVVLGPDDNYWASKIGVGLLKSNLPKTETHPTD